MKRLSSRLQPLCDYFTLHCHSPHPSCSFSLIDCIHTTTPKAAQPLPHTAQGPPPPAPVPTSSEYGERVDRRRRQASLLKSVRDVRSNSGTKPGTAMTKRFWKDVNIDLDAEQNHTLHLDTRPIKNPTTKTPLLIPPSKPHLATAIALEWDSLTSAQQALKQHLMPLTSLASRAHALALEDADNARRGLDVSGAGHGIRYEIINMMLRYLDTDTLLCWAPPAETELPPELTPSENQPAVVAAQQRDKQSSAEASLRDHQIRTATPILAYLTTQLWPGVELIPVLDDKGSILPKSQPAATRAVIQGWMAGLPAWELVGLERAVLTGKSLCVGARLVGEWGENIGRNAQRLGRNDEGQEEQRFGIQEAVEASSLEVKWQTGRWGEVEDTHDVDNEDIARQFGSVILLVSGTGE